MTSDPRWYDPVMGAHRMIGRARWLVACVVAALLLAACSGSDGSTAPPPGLRLHTLTATASLGGTTEPLMWASW